MSEISNEKITSLNEYNKYLKVIRPSGWLVVTSIVILIGIGVFWAFTGSILTTQQCKSVVQADVAIGYVGLENSEKVQVGQSINLTVGDTIVGGVIESVGAVPVDIAEVEKTLGSTILAKNVLPESGGVQVIARLSRSIESGQSVIASMEIITQDVTPIQLVMG